MHGPFKITQPPQELQDKAADHAWVLCRVQLRELTFPLRLSGSSSTPELSLFEGTLPLLLEYLSGSCTEREALA